MSNERKWVVDLTSGDGGLAPLTVSLENGLTLVRMPYGNFAISISTVARLECCVKFDGVELIKRKLQPGFHNLAASDASVPLVFQLPSLRLALPVLPGGVDASQDEARRASLDTASAPCGGSSAACGGSSAACVHARRDLSMPASDFGENGRLVITLAHIEEDTGDQTRDYTVGSEVLTYQFNPPGLHERVLARNMHLMVPSPDLEGTPPPICGHAH